MYKILVQGIIQVKLLDLSLHGFMQILICVELRNYQI